jgi:uncharacterized membrane protein (Fun14 family)
MKFRDAFRRLTNVVMFTLTGLCAVAAVSVLFFILSYLVWKGGSALNWDFLTKLPKPVGEAGGGMANAIVGSAKLLLLATLSGVPVGFLAGVYLAEFGGGGMFSFAVRYVTDLLNGVPSIVIGIFAYTMVVLPMRHFSTLAGGLALGLMMIPIAVRSTEESGAGAGLEPLAGRRHGGHSGGNAGNRHGSGFERRPGGGRDRALALHQLQQPLLESRLEPAHRLFAGHDLYLRDFALRRLAPAGVGRRLGAAGAGADGQRRRAALGLRPHGASTGVKDECHDKFLTDGPRV